MSGTRVGVKWHRWRCADEEWLLGPLGVRSTQLEVGEIWKKNIKKWYFRIGWPKLLQNRWTLWHWAERVDPRAGNEYATGRRSSGCLWLVYGMKTKNLFFSENSLFAIGGNSGTCSLDSCEKYDPILDKWSPIAPMKNRRWKESGIFYRRNCKYFRAGAGIAVIGPYLYVIGGFG